MSTLLDQNVQAQENQEGFADHGSMSKSLNFLMDKNLHIMTQVVRRCYSDVSLMRDYRGLREAYRHEDIKNKAGMREIYKPPHPYVHRFIDAEMSKKYGEAWKQDKQTFRKVCKKEPLIEPWLVVPRDKI